MLVSHYMEVTHYNCLPPLQAFGHKKMIFDTSRNCYHILPSFSFVNNVSVVVAFISSHYVHINTIRILKSSANAIICNSSSCFCLLTVCMHLQLLHLGAEGHLIAYCKQTKAEQWRLILELIKDMRIRAIQFLIT